MKENGDYVLDRPFRRKRNGTHAVRPKGERQGWRESTGDPDKKQGSHCTMREGDTTYGKKKMVATPWIEQGTPAL